MDNHEHQTELQQPDDANLSTLPISEQPAIPEAPTASPSCEEAKAEAATSEGTSLSSPQPELGNVDPESSGSESGSSSKVSSLTCSAPSDGSSAPQDEAEVSTEINPGENQATGRDHQEGSLSDGETGAKSDSSGSCSSLTHTSNEQTPNHPKESAGKSDASSNSCSSAPDSPPQKATKIKISAAGETEEPQSAQSPLLPQEKASQKGKNRDSSRKPRFSVLRKNDSNPLGAARSRASARKSTCSDSGEDSESLATCNSSSGSSSLSTRSNYQILGFKVDRGIFGRDDSLVSRSSRFSRSTSSSSYFYRLGLGGVGGFWLACGALVVLFTIVTFLVATAATSGSTSSILGSMSGTAAPFPLKTIVATRLHNRQATHALTDDAVRHKIRVFSEVCKMADAVQGVIAVDADDATLLKQVNKEIESSSTPMAALPITPWGRFVPALNALIGYAASLPDQPDCILFVSAETSATRQSVQALLDKMLEHPQIPDAGGAFPRLRSSKLAAEPPRLDNSTLVAGALLPGHDYQSVAERDGADEEKAIQQVELNGRTTPWNTLAVWNLRKLATTGFLLLSEGFLTSADDEPSYGVEEVVTIALLQKLLGEENARAKLIPVPDIRWESEFTDPERKLWHQSKMESKLARAARQMKIAKLEGIVHHY